VPNFDAELIRLQRCELAHAFAERDYVRDLLEPLITMTISHASSFRRTRRSAHFHEEPVVSSSDVVAAVTVGDRAPVPEECSGMNGDRVRDFLDRLQAGAATLPPDIQPNSVTYRHSSIQLSPLRSVPGPQREVYVNVVHSYTFRLKQRVPAAASSLPAR
jgi:hypothetical protein